MLVSDTQAFHFVLWEYFDVILSETSTMNKQTQLKLKICNILFFITCISNLVITLIYCSGMVMKKVFFFRNKFIGFLITNLY